VTRALHGTRTGVELAFGERPIIMRAAILDRVQRPGAVEYADLSAIDFDQLHLAGRKPGLGADADFLAQLLFCGCGCRHLKPTVAVGF
jgi:hypothetical protein